MNLLGSRNSVAARTRSCAASSRSCIPSMMCDAISCWWEGRESRGPIGISRFAKVERVKLHARKARPTGTTCRADSANNFSKSYINPLPPDPFLLLQATLRAFSSPQQLETFSGFSILDFGIWSFFTDFSSSTVQRITLE